MKFSHFSPIAPSLSAKNGEIAPENVREPILSNINLEIPAHCHCALVGANGAGKSTLLKTFAGLIRPLKGTFCAFGVPVKPPIPKLCYLAQRSQINWDFPISVREMAATGRFIHKNFFAKLTREDLKIADNALEKLALSELAKRNIGELSGGQQQRVLLARALCQDAKLLLLDEPYAGLDTRSRDIMDRILFGPTGKDLTIVMATHDLSEALGHFDSILKIENKKLAIIRSCRGHEKIGNSSW